MASDDWIPVFEAPQRVDRSLATIYRWLATGRIRTMRPMRVLWLYLPDLLRVKADSTTRYPVHDTPE